jgi:hypothetical protein
MKKAEAKQKDRMDYVGGPSGGGAALASKAWPAQPAPKPAPASAPAPSQNPAPAALAPKNQNVFHNATHFRKVADGRRRVPWSDEEISILEKVKMCGCTYTHVHIYL